MKIHLNKETKNQIRQSVHKWRETGRSCSGIHFRGTFLEECKEVQKYLDLYYPDVPYKIYFLDPIPLNWEEFKTIKDRMISLIAEKIWNVR